MGEVIAIHFAHCQTHVPLCITQRQAGGLVAGDGGGAGACGERGGTSWEGAGAGRREGRGRVLEGKDGDGLKCGKGDDDVVSVPVCWSVIFAGPASHLENTCFVERHVQRWLVLPEKTQLGRVFDMWTVYRVHVSTTSQCQH